MDEVYKILVHGLEAKKKPRQITYHFYFRCFDWSKKTFPLRWQTRANSRDAAQLVPRHLCGCIVRACSLHVLLILLFLQPCPTTIYAGGPLCGSWDFKTNNARSVRIDCVYIVRKSKFTMLLLHTVHEYTCIVCICNVPALEFGAARFTYLYMYLYKNFLFLPN